MSFPDTLVFGASGFIGRRLSERLGPGRVVGTCSRAPIKGGIRFDGATDRLSDVLPRGSGPTVRRAFLLHGITDLDVCARDPSGAARVNVAGMERLIGDLLDRGIAPIFTSTDAVFDGERGGYREEDEPFPIIEYGRQKRAVERLVLERGWPVLIVRLSKVVGTTPGTHSLFGEWSTAVEAGRPVLCATDQIFSPIALDDAVSILIDLAERGVTGIVHVAGPEARSRYDLHALFREASTRIGRDVPPAEPRSIRDFPFAEPRPRDTSLRIDRLISLASPRFTPLSALVDDIARSSPPPSSRNDRRD